MGVKRMETRLITELVGQRLEAVRLKQLILNTKTLIDGADEEEFARLDAKHAELHWLYDILGGYNE